MACGLNVHPEVELERENARLRAYVAELESRVARLEHLADSDTLTPLANRRYLFRVIERAVAQRARHGTASSVVFIDLDGLKAINDAQGHLIGDEVLIHTAWILRENVRTGDVVARIGGDEFGVLLDYADADVAREKADGLCAAVAARPLHGRVPISISAGVTALEATDTPEAALARADGAMYRVKRSK